MKVGLFLATINPIATPEYIAAFARGAEERGFDSLWVGEHALLFDDYESAYPYSENGKLIGLTAESGMLDPFLAEVRLAEHQFNGAIAVRLFQMEMAVGHRHDDIVHLVAMPAGMRTGREFPLSDTHALIVD